jgi:hypothetical protein
MDARRLAGAPVALAVPLLLIAASLHWLAKQRRADWMRGTWQSRSKFVHRS